jgi:hypothetical protein
VTLRSFIIPSYSRAVLIAVIGPSPVTPANTKKVPRNPCNAHKKIFQAHSLRKKNPSGTRSLLEKKIFFRPYTLKKIFRPVQHFKKNFLSLLGHIWERMSRRKSGAIIQSLYFCRVFFHGGIGVLDRPRFRTPRM